MRTSLLPPRFSRESFLVSIVVDAGGVDFVVATFLEDIKDGLEFWNCVDPGTCLGLRAVLVRFTQLSK